LFVGLYVLYEVVGVTELFHTFIT